MPRGRAKGYDEQREQILRRAAKLFAQHGYTATSMNDVAEACGVSKPSLYHYVDDKHRLLAEICAGHIARLKALVDEVVTEPEGAAPRSAEQRLRLMIEAFMKAYAGAQAEHRVLTEDVKFLAPAERRRVLDGEREVVAAFADAVVAARPELAEAALDKPLTMLLFGMMNWLFTWLKPGGALTHEAMAPVVADLFFGGLHAVAAAPDAAPAQAPLRTKAPSCQIARSSKA